MSTTSNISFREPSSADCDLFAPVVVELACRGTFAAFEVDFDKGLSVLKAWLNDPSRFLRVAEVDGQPAGMMIGYVVQQWFSRDVSGHDSLIFVAPQYRGLGIGKRLAGEFEAWGRERGAKVVFLHASIGIENDRAAAVFESLGYRHVGPIYVKDMDHV